MSVRVRPRSLLRKARAWQERLAGSPVRRRGRRREPAGVLVSDLQMPSTSDVRFAIITHMARTTIDIDAVVLRRLKERKLREDKTLGQLVSELLAGALRETDAVAPRELSWTSRPMGARVDLEDKEAVRRALEGR